MSLPNMQSHGLKKNIPIICAAFLSKIQLFSKILSKKNMLKKTLRADRLEK